jgi:hypothetical protein
VVESNRDFFNRMVHNAHYFHIFLVQWNLITFNCAVLLFSYVYIFPTKAHPPLFKK